MTGENTTKIHHALDTILKFSALINSSLKIEDVLNNAMKWAEEFINAEASSIYELDEEKNELFVRLARGEKKEPMEKLRLKVGEGISGYVVETGKAMVIQDVHKEERFDERFDRITGFKTKSMICVPLTIRNKTNGAFQVLNKKGDEPFTLADLELLTGMAQQLTIAMENARLYSRLEEKFELTEQELSLTQKKLILSERLAAIGHIVNGVAHEIRNPIMTIGGFARRVKSSLSDKEKLLEYADIILNETARLERLVIQVNKFAEIQTAVFCSDNILSVLEKVVDKFLPAAKEMGVQIKTEFPATAQIIDMDSPQIATAISNIIENSLESIHENGEIKIKLDHVNTGIIIEISDTGKGINKHELDSIFDPFTTSKSTGAGLGMTMVNQIIMNHHGEIRIDTTEGKGTTLSILLPINQDQTNWRWR
ncbi:MAG: GAF domain-containing protein [Deltaproteobacteria bacterium]|nr:GAF domain-containing protein [Deltaproteobacteria bacterium]